MGNHGENCDLYRFKRKTWISAAKIEIEARK